MFDYDSTIINIYQINNILISDMFTEEDLNKLTKIKNEYNEKR